MQAWCDPSVGNPQERYDFLLIQRMQLVFGRKRLSLGRFGGCRLLEINVLCTLENALQADWKKIYQPVHKEGRGVANIQSKASLKTLFYDVFEISENSFSLCQ